MPKKNAKLTASQRAAEEKLRGILKEALCYILPQEQAEAAVKSIGQRLGAFSTTLKTPEDVLATVPGVGADTARFLRCCIDLAKAYMESSSSSMRFIIDSESAEELFRPFFLDKTTEHVALALLDPNSQLLFCDIVGSGQLSAAPLNTREMLALALKYDARFALLAHNHTSNNVFPSSDDVLTTSILVSAFSSLGITLRDHLILTKDDMLSFADSGILRTIFVEDREKRRSLIEDARLVAKLMDEAADSGDS